MLVYHDDVSNEIKKNVQIKHNIKVRRNISQWKISLPISELPMLENAPTSLCSYKLIIQFISIPELLPDVCHYCIWYNHNVLYTYINIYNTLFSKSSDDKLSFLSMTYSLFYFKRWEVIVLLQTDCLAWHVSR